MSLRLSIFLACAAALLGDIGIATAGGENAFFGVGLTVLKAAPELAPGIIYRNAIYTPGAVAIGLAGHGYKHINLVSRDIDGYVFSAVSRRNGLRYIVTVAALRGEIISAARG